MIRRALSVLVLAWLAGRAPARAQAIGPGAHAGSTLQFAIVIGNNRSASPRAEVLRFADDDALAIHELLLGAGVRSVLLARLDETSRQLHPHAVTNGAPRWSDLDAVFGWVASEMSRERTAGSRVELLLFYSGHGDVEHGEGYLVLEDRRLTRTVLARMLERSPATRNHVVIDACKSYFMAFEKGPGGRRTRFTGSFAAADTLTPGRLANAGFVLSTSSGRDSHEWERFGGGVFSHAVRSALRGAADVDRDGGITYAELGAFLATASQAVANPRFRPDFLIRPPGGERRDLAETLLRWDAPPRSAVVVDQPVGHIYVETATGDRVLDAHPAAPQQLVLRLPAARPLFLRRDDASIELLLASDQLVRVSELVARPSSIGRRGAAHLAFEELFAVPFGEASVRDYHVRWASEAELLDAGEPGPHRTTRATIRTIAGATALTSGALALATSSVLVERFVASQSESGENRVRINRTLRHLAIGGVALGAMAVVSGAAWLALRDRAPREDEIAVGPLLTGPAPASGIGVAVGGVW